MKSDQKICLKGKKKKENRKLKEKIKIYFTREMLTFYCPKTKHGEFLAHV